MPTNLKAGIKGDGHQVRIGAAVDFRLTLTNRSDQSCLLDLNADNYELKVYSGTDRIWSTDDCTRLVTDRKQTLEPGEAAAWKISWNGKRSRHGKSCQTGPEIPRAGYYYATSQLNGAKPVQYLLILK
ncbi:hypothetical protein FOE78_04185 [Microlunatus elymi]|uniref:Intracellular proteinase inhibitor BsuPI domain-containing protein n=1 Tax=Microlunatus elymi TaxID=2596828 RepID=A0A516PVK7_9ACTN|nr:BsuPI-related putative proteinase inhibitor [Microlunatus elymi]QDP95217.1 hypothetical protein FOE78_04185 [Microlunatus elymi]